MRIYSFSLDRLSGCVEQIENFIKTVDFFHDLIMSEVLHDLFIYSFSHNKNKHKLRLRGTIEAIAY